MNPPDLLETKSCLGQVTKPEELADDRTASSLLPLSGNVQAGEDSCMRSKSSAFSKCASGYHPAQPPPADTASAPKHGGSRAGSAEGNYSRLSVCWCRTNAELLYYLSLLLPPGNGTRSIAPARPGLEARRAHAPLAPLLPRAGGADHCGGKGRSGSFLPPRRGGRGTPRPTTLPVPARRLITLILSTAASSFSCSTSRCMVLRLPPEDIPRERRRG